MITQSAIDNVIGVNLSDLPNKSEYTLDAIGGVVIRTAKVLFEIPCEW